MHRDFKEFDYARDLNQFEKIHFFWLFFVILQSSLAFGEKENYRFVGAVIAKSGWGRDCKITESAARWNGMLVNGLITIVGSMRGFPSNQPGFGIPAGPTISEHAYVIVWPESNRINQRLIIWSQL